MKDHQVGAILAKYGVKRTEQGQRAKEQKNAILAKYGVTSSRERKITSQPQTQAVAKRPSVTREQAAVGAKNAILAKYGVTPSRREEEILTQPQTQAVAKRPGMTQEQGAVGAKGDSGIRARAGRMVSAPTKVQNKDQAQFGPGPYAQRAGIAGSTALPYAAAMQRVELPKPESPAAPTPSRFQALPSVEGLSERDALRQESRLRTQLAKGMSPEELGERAELREQRLQNIPAQELEKRHEQAVGHLEEAQRAIASQSVDPETLEEIPGADPALYQELGKWQGIVDELAGRYYYRKNGERAAALSGDREGQSRVQAVEDILSDLRTLGEIAAGEHRDRRAVEALETKYGLSERELEGQATALIQRLQGELEQAKEAAKAAGYDYDRMKQYQERMEQVQRAIEGQRHTEEFAQEHPVLSSAASILAGPAQGVDYLAQLAKGYGHSDSKSLESYVPANVYEMRATNFVRNVRGTVAEKIAESPVFAEAELGGENLGSFLYQTGMSMLDFLFNAMATGNFSGGLGGTGTQAAQRAAGDLSLAIMGSGAAANTTAEAIGRGLSNREAFTLGAIAGVAEMVTEKVSLETLLDRTALDRSAVGYLLKNVLAEGSEEVASDLINWAGDVLVSKDRSQWTQAIQAYEAQGMGEKEAFQMALKDQLISMGMSGLGGGLSGGVMAGGRIAIDSAVESYQNRGAAAGPEVVQTEKTAPVKKAGEYYVEDPVNVENPTVPIIDISLDELAMLNGGRLPKQGSYIRDTVIGRARKRLGLDQNEAAYIPASNISRGGEEYVLKVTKSTLSKMFSPADGSAVPLETAVAVEHLEEIANNAVWYKGEGDRKGRKQIRGVDHLLTTVYIDGVPTVIDMTVRITQQTSRGEMYNVLYYLEPEAIAITGQKGSGATSAAERRAFRGEMSPLHKNIISQQEGKVNNEDIKIDSDDRDTPTSLTAESDAQVDELLGEGTMVRFLTKRGGLKLTKDMTLSQRREALRQAMAQATGLTTEKGETEAALNGLRQKGRQVRQTEKTASTKKPRMRMEDFTDVQSPIWNNVVYEDTKTQWQIMRDTHQRMVESGEIVKISRETAEWIGQYYPNLQAVKKAERTPILKQKMSELKVTLRGILNRLKGSHEFEVNGSILDVKLYDVGVREVMERITQSRAEMLTHSEEIFQKAQYIYSTPDYDGDPNIYRWNYFYTPVQMRDGEIVGVRIAIRDMKQTQHSQAESQLYHWGIKKAPALDGESPDVKSLSFGVSSAGADGSTLDGGRPGETPNATGVSSVETSDIILPQGIEDVKGQVIQEGEDHTGKPESKRLPKAEEAMMTEKRDTIEQGTSMLSDAQVDELLGEETMVRFLTKRGGLKLTKDMTLSQRREAVRKAVARIGKGEFFLP